MKQAEKNIILVDDHVVVRSGLKELLEKLGPYRVVQQFDSGSAFVEALPLQPEPDLVIMDVYMPGMNGDDVLHLLRERNIATPVLVLTLNEEESVIVRLFRLGARGYLKKNCTAATLKEALQAIFETGYYHNEFLAYSLQHNTVPTQTPEHEKTLERLSEREREFLKLVCNEAEYTYEQIASLMFVQPRTVDGYRESIFEKFGVKSKTGLVLFVLRHRLMDHL